MSKITSEAAGPSVVDATAQEPAPADTGPDATAGGRDDPDTATAATDPPTDPSTPSVETRPTVGRTPARSRKAKPKVSDAASNGTASRKTARTVTASAPGPDADPGGSPDIDATADSGPHAAPVEVATAPTATSEHPTNSDATEDTIATEGSSRANPSGTVRLKSGALQGLVEDYLTEHPGEHSPTAVGKAIARSSGAVANALDRMVASGWAVRTCDKPKRYRIAEGSDSGPADVATDDTGTEESHPADSAVSDGSAIDRAPSTAPTATARTVDADNAPPAGRQTRRRAKMA